MGDGPKAGWPDGSPCEMRQLNDTLLTSPQPQPDGDAQPSVISSHACCHSKLGDRTPEKSLYTKKFNGVAFSRSIAFCTSPDSLLLLFTSLNFFMPSTIDGWSRSVNGSHHVFTAKEFEKPDNDDRQYRLIRLPNQLEALLIHDANTDKASAALDVHVGNLSDPVSKKEMAHTKPIFPLSSFLFFFFLFGGGGWLATALSVSNTILAGGKKEIKRYLLVKSVKR